MFTPVSKPENKRVITTMGPGTLVKQHAWNNLYDIVLDYSASGKPCPFRRCEWRYKNEDKEIVNARW